MKNSEELKQKIEESRYSKPENALWLLQQGFKNKFKPNRNELISFNTLAKFYEQNKKDNLQNNELFAKMFIFVYSHFLKYYKASVFDDIPQKQLYSLLDKPISYFITRLTDELNDSEIHQYLKEKDIGFNRMTKEELKNIDIDKLTEKTFDEETVAEQMNAMINKFINYSR